MANNVSLKKTTFMANLINTAILLQQANNTLVNLQSQYANEYAAGQATPIVDADCLLSTNTQHLTAAIIISFFSGPQSSVATSVSTNLQALLPVLPY